MKQSFLVFLFFIPVLTSFSQDCANHTQFKQGTAITTTSYNEKDKVQGSTKATCISVSTNGESIISNMKAESFDKNGKEQAVTDFTMTCNKGVILMDMKMSVPQQSASQYKNMEMKIDGENLEFPTSLSVGQKLKDGKATMTFTSAGMPMTIVTEINTKDRKVEAKENITTPAGIYECYKISSDIESTSNIMGKSFTVNMKSVQWYNAGVGAVRSEDYDKDGKMSGYSLITEIKK